MLMPSQNHYIVCNKTTNNDCFNGCSSSCEVLIIRYVSPSDLSIEPGSLYAGEQYFISLGGKTCIWSYIVRPKEKMH